MTTIVTADIHLSENSRDAYRLDFLDKLKEISENIDARRIIILGDITEEKDKHSAWLVNQIVDRLAALTESGADVIILKGNHDYVDEHTPFYRFLDHIPRVRWINTPWSHDLRGLGRCLFLPHTNSPDLWGKDFDLENPDWIFCHQTFDGADVGHGHKMEGVSRSIFPRNADVIAGDVHVPQTIGNVTYVGAPYHVDFGDNYEPRLLILPKFENMPCRSPQKMVIDLSGTDLETAFDITGLVPGDVVKIVADPSHSSPMARSQYRALIRERAIELGIDVHTVQIKAEKKTTTKTKTPKARQERSDEDLLKAYVKRQGERGKGMVTTGLNLLEKA